MSKIPLAGEGMRTEDEAYRNKARFWKNALISLIALSITAGIIALIEYFALGRGDMFNLPLRLAGDAIGLSGVLGFSAFVLGYVSSRGAFDLVSYSVKLVFLNVFRPKYRQESFPKSYYEYKVMKDHEERKAVFPLLWVSLVYLVVGIIIISIYFTQIN
jgi:cytochrome bd-type quinol oxidase subunit 1